jgi:2-oxoisovalerate dehydrogenase E1 component beta subunit
MVHETLKAAKGLSEADGIEACVVDLRSISPLDRDAILEGARRTGKVLIVHEDNLTGGVGAEVAAIIAQEAFESLDAPIMRLAAPDVPSFPYAPPLEEFCLPNAEKIADALRRLAAY